MNPEEGDLRPQLLDRFGMCVTVTGEPDATKRVAIIERRLAFEADPAGFVASWRAETAELSRRIERASKWVPQVVVDRDVLLQVAQTCLTTEVDGHRADIMMVRAARALAAWDGRTEIIDDDLTQAAQLVLPHRMRRRPLEAVGRL